MTLRVGERLEDCLAKINKIVTLGHRKYERKIIHLIFIYCLYSRHNVIDIRLFLYSE